MAPRSSLLASLRRLAPTFALLAVAANPVLAQPPPAQPALPAPDPSFEAELDALFSSGGLTADQAATRARSVSPSVQRSIAEIEVAIAQAQATELTRVPQVGATASYNRLSSIDAPVIPLDPMTGMGFSFPVLLNTYSVSARAAVNLSDYVLRYPKLIDAAKLGTEVARVQRRSVEVNASQEARIAFYEWVRAELQVLISRRQLAQVRSTLGQVRALAEVQRISRADLMRVESNEAQADQISVQLQNLADLREEQLRLIIGAEGNQPLTIGEDIRVDVSAPAAQSVDGLLGTAKKQRLDFRVLDTGIQAKEKQREAERANFFPKLSAFAQADYANPNQRIFPQSAEFNLTWMLGAQVSWTLNDTLLARTTDRRLRGETNELRADRESLERGTRIQILSAQQAVVVAQAALATSKKGLEAAEESYRVRRELLAAQRATAVELVDAETELTRARIAALNARVDLRVALAQLAHAIGADVTPDKS